MIGARSDISVFGSLSDALHLVIEWVERVHGVGGMERALELLLNFVNGDSALLLRLHLDMGTQNNIAWVGHGANREPPGESGMSFSQYLLGHGVGQAQPGTLWYMSDFVRELDAADAFAGGLGVTNQQTREVLVAVLEPRRTTSDILEIHFTRRLSTKETEALRTVVEIASRAWRNRPQAERAAALGEPILGAANPARLSKSEYRVCSLVSRGMDARRISESLQISESTVRSHLRSIYAKTKTSGQRELMYRLLNSERAHRASPVGLAGIFEAVSPSRTQRV